MIVRGWTWRAASGGRSSVRVSVGGGSDVCGLVFLCLYLFASFILLLPIHLWYVRCMARTSTILPGCGLNTFFLVSCIMVSAFHFTHSTISPSPPSTITQKTNCTFAASPKHASRIPYPTPHSTHPHYLPYSQASRHHRVGHAYSRPCVLRASSYLCISFTYLPALVPDTYYTLHVS